MLSTFSSSDLLWDGDVSSDTGCSLLIVEASQVIKSLETHALAAWLDPTQLESNCMFGHGGISRSEGRGSPFDKVLHVGVPKA